MSWAPPRDSHSRDAMHAVIQTGGRQLLVRAGDKIQLEGLDPQVGDEVTFDKVLSVGDRLGSPFLDGASVKGKVITTGRGPKIYVQKFKRRKNYRRRVGHRAPVYQVEITEVPES